MRRHGTFRPNLIKLVSSNSHDELVIATNNAFEHYANHKDDISGTLNRLAKSLKGIGPAAASLLLSIHDPQNVVYFSDELYRWLCANGRKVNLKYTIKEYQTLFDEAKIFMSRIKCTTIELEKVAYVLVKDHDSSSKLESKDHAASSKPKEGSKNTTKNPSKCQLIDVTVFEELPVLNETTSAKTRQKKSSQECIPQIEKNKSSENVSLNKENKKTSASNISSSRHKRKKN